MFKKDQKVWCAICGAGVVAEVKDDSAVVAEVKDDRAVGSYNVIVKFTDELSNIYTNDGKYFAAGNVTLFPHPIEIVKAVTKPTIDWSHVSEHFKYLAMDSGGLHHLFAEKPERSSREWTTCELYIYAEHFASFVPGTCDWKDSLVKRPS